MISASCAVCRSSSSACSCIALSGSRISHWWRGSTLFRSWRASLSWCRCTSDGRISSSCRSWRVLLLSLSADRGRLAGWLQARWLVWLGDISFSIYLTHYAVGRLYRGQEAFVQSWLSADPGTAAVARFVELMVVFTLVGWATSRWFEGPIRLAIRAMIKRIEKGSTLESSANA